MNSKLIILTISLIILVIALFVPWPFRALPLPVRAAFDFAHLPLFLCLTIFISWLWKDLSAVRVALIAVACAVCIEIIQPFTGRSAEIGDLIYNCLGILLGLSVITVKSSNINNKKLLCSLCLIIVLAASSYKITSTTAAYMKFVKAFPPVISDFSDLWYQELWISGLNEANKLKCQTPDHSNSGKYFQCLVTDEALSTIEFSPGVMDWSVFTILNINLINHGDPFNLHIRIDDSETCHNYKCRFNASNLVKSGEVTLRIPLMQHMGVGHKLSLNHIIRLILFTQETPVGHSFSIKKIHLSD